ncbi:Ribosomal RNA small subunit methyltransferase E [Candidatus Bealeia paramacronuclearis]|uniref:Ribosomal RNA small subunit methyltransferase E n=1 Tax=Candidatus Bealeia paramacronuclearis TaxID=1921001 RepID=A0ABZ2C0R1_9PROT|nr:Ribosomal RNA small subunit methyltransferase E [Candidatus Bealeia paramacronuclearis]
MSKIRIFVDASFQTGIRLPLNSTQEHYLLHVMRLKDSAPVHVFNGRDGEWVSQFISHKRHPQLLLQSQIFEQTPAPQMGLIFSPLKPKRLEFLIEKATELNVGRLYPTVMEHTAFPKVNLEKIQNYTIEAAEQSERLSIPDIQHPQKLFDLLNIWPQDHFIFWASERQNHSSLRIALANALPSLTFLIGPEGGFSPKEIQYLEKLPFIIPVSLGPTILRAETAALMCLSVGLQADLK